MCVFSGNSCTVAENALQGQENKKYVYQCRTLFDVYPCPMSCLVHSDAIKLAAELLYVYILGNASVLFVSVKILQTFLHVY